MSAFSTAIFLLQNISQSLILFLNHYPTQYFSPQFFSYHNLWSTNSLKDYFFGGPKTYSGFFEFTFHNSFEDYFLFFVQLIRGSFFWVHQLLRGLFFLSLPTPLGICLEGPASAFGILEFLGPPCSLSEFAAPIFLLRHISQMLFFFSCIARFILLHPNFPYTLLFGPTISLGLFWNLSPELGTFWAHQLFHIFFGVQISEDYFLGIPLLRWNFWFSGSTSFMSEWWWWWWWIFP